MFNMNTYRISEFAEIIGVSVKTLQRWDRQKKLVPDRTPTNRRIYTEHHLSTALGRIFEQEERETVVYARVSSQNQKPDLENQIEVLTEFCNSSGYTVDKYVKEVGGGLNFKRKKFVKLLDQVMSGKIEQLIVAHKDRLSRFGFDLIEHICKVNNCELIVMNNEKLSPEQEMIQDMLAIVHCFSARLYGLRNYRKALDKALEDDKSTQDQN